MLKNEYLRFLKSKFNFVLIFFMSILVALSYYSTYLDKQEWIKVLNSGAEDVNLAAVEKMVNGYTGVAYFDRFIFGDFYIVFILVALIGFGIHLCSTTFSNLQSGYGSLLVSRLGYERYIKNLVIAQVLYIFTFILLFHTVLLLGSIAIGGTGFAQDITTFTRLGDINGINYIFALTAQIIMGPIFVSLVVSLVSLSTPYLKNKYLIQISPFFVYFIFLFISSTIGNISPTFGTVTRYFVPDSFLKSVYFNSISHTSLLDTVLSFVALPLLLLALTIYMYSVNVESYTEDYIVWH
ncbi:hypothetical protein PRVXT_002410 [Proteinivorax tanatarense]|uniref:ABC transporter permease n=1 Tax=Proteinivorax tanatarense TaxID=1260629 RepID=A0AAU7VK20_9FIRM